jgi:hypothetical protein
MNNDPSDLADKSAIAISVICVLHCLFTPLLLVSAPYLAGFAIFEGEALHLWLLCLVVPISIGSIGYGFSKHGDKSTLYLAGTGILLLILALTVGHDLFEHLGDLSPQAT